MRLISLTYFSAGVPIKDKKLSKYWLIGNKSFIKNDKTNRFLTTYFFKVPLLLI